MTNLHGAATGSCFHAARIYRFRSGFIMASSLPYAECDAFPLRSAASGNRSPRRVLCENVVLCLHYRMAREPALRVVPLRRLVSQGCGRERVGRGVIVERAPSPSPAVREPLTVLHHEI